MGSDGGDGGAAVRVEKMKIVISGANGFIGSWLIKEMLAKTDHQIWALVRPESDRSKLPEHRNLKVIGIDYEREEQIRGAVEGKDVCIHLIGQMGKYGVADEIYEKINVELTRWLLQICEEEGIGQFIFCSTPGVQGFGHRLAREEEPYAPRNLYEITKVHAEQCVMDFCKGKKIAYTIIRPDFVYGPEDTRRVKMYKNIQKKRFILTTNGKSYLHPTYVTDVAQGFIRAIGRQEAYNQVFNISAAQDVTAKEFITAIADCVHSKPIHFNIGYGCSVFLAGVIEKICAKILHKDAFVSRNKIDFLALNHSTSIEKAEKLLGYHPEVSLQEGMKRTIDWCYANGLLD